jgi:uncharacterized membrane protein (DUF2068 family)
MAATVLLAVLAALGLVAAPIGADEHGASFVVICIVVSALRGIAAAGVWRMWRWAAILGFVVTLIDTLLAVPGIFDGSSTGMQVLSALAVPINVATLIVLAWPTSRRAYA